MNSGLWFHICAECPYGDEEGMCESRGAEWKKGKWHPTNECMPKEE